MPVASPVADPEPWPAAATAAAAATEAAAAGGAATAREAAATAAAGATPAAGATAKKAVPAQPLLPLQPLDLHCRTAPSPPTSASRRVGAAAASSATVDHVRSGDADPKISSASSAGTNGRWRRQLQRRGREGARRALGVALLLCAKLAVGSQSPQQVSFEWRVPRHVPSGIAPSRLWGSRPRMHHARRARACGWHGRPPRRAAPGGAGPEPIRDAGIPGL